MNAIPTKLHGVFDYLYGAFLVALPWLFGYAAIGGPETWIPVVLGVFLIGYSLLTDYELGLSRRIDMRAHLLMDAMVGATLLISLVYFGFFDVTLWLPHLIAGLVGIAAAVITDRQPYRQPAGIQKVH